MRVNECDYLESKKKCGEQSWQDSGRKDKYNDSRADVSKKDEEGDRGGAGEDESIVESVKDIKGM